MFLKAAMNACTQQKVGVRMCDIGLILLKILRPWVKQEDTCLNVEKLVSGTEKEKSEILEALTKHSTVTIPTLGS